MDVSNSYDRVASIYSHNMYFELEDKPLDVELLDHFALSINPTLPLIDLGCGPAHVGNYLYSKGFDVIGLDISAEMICEARMRNPALKLVQADYRSIPYAPNSIGAICAFYSLIHTPLSELPSLLEHFYEVLAPEGHLFFSFHEGTGTVHLDQWWDHEVDLDFHHFTKDQILDVIGKTKFDLLKLAQRPPYPPEIEHQSNRCYVLLQK